MSRTWLVVDGNYLAYRAFFAMGGQGLDSVRDGVVYGFLRDVQAFTKYHQTDDVVFCFDHGKSLRESVYPGYKAKRKEQLAKLTHEERRDREELKRQINLLKTDYLPFAGFKNVFYQDGYEADDMIASVIDNTRISDQVIVVGADKDLYQLLSDRVSLWVPTTKRIITKDVFVEEYGIEPERWAKALAIAGCETDNVKGVEGVGVVTACKYLTARLNKNGDKYRKIKAAERLCVSNMKLVSLPYDGVFEYAPTPHPLDRKRWNVLVVNRLGMPSLDESSVALASVGGEDY